MQDSVDASPDDEINLTELLMALWAHKLLIAGACVLGVIFGGYQTRNAEKQFTSEAIFKLDQGQPGGLSIDASLGALASLAGMSFGSSGSAGSKLPIDKLNGRIFNSIR